MKIKKILVAITLSASMLWQQGVAMANPERAKVQISIILDSSNSMDGLIDQTRTQIWKIVNALTGVTKNGQVPNLQIALYQYGNNRIPSQEGFVRILTGLTTDLDLVSEKLFAIKTLGGQEYAGWAIKSAIEELNWTDSAADFRAIFIAGNEPFNQGPVDFRQAIELALKEDILVNTIYCGSAENPESNLWAESAYLANSSNVNIDQNQKTDFVESPYDEEIAGLNAQLNNTYIPYGEEGTRGVQRQQRQDANAGQHLVTRGLSKTSTYYRNENWDLIDAIDEDLVSLSELNPEDLPPEMQNMTLAEQENYVAAMKAQRITIQSRMQELDRLRKEYVSRKTRAGINTQPNNTLESVMLQTLEEQLAVKGFELNQ